MLLILVAFAILSIACLIGFFITAKKNRVLSKLGNRNAILLYLAFAIVISAGGLIALSPLASHSMLYFMLLQLGYGGLGYLAAYIYRRNAPSEVDGGRFAGVFFVLANALIGMFGFVLVYRHFDPSGIAPWFSFCVLPFLLPEFLRVCFEAYREIPHDIHKIWYFPLDEEEFEYGDDAVKGVIYMLELEYSKSVNDARLTNTKLRAPVSVKFGDWFRSFIESYNYKHEEDPIQYTDDDRSPYGWIFYVKPSLLGTARYIDPELTIAANRISEKNIIQAKRVGIVEDEEGM